MRLLILGQTAFLGRALVETIVGRGLELVVAGQTTLDREKYMGVEWVDTTPEEALYRVGGRTFDAVIDLSASRSMQTLHTALSLSDRTNLYIMMSSISAYRDFSTAGMDETYATARMPEGMEERAGDFATYGARLALCEERVAEALPGRALIIRPGLLAGPYDCTDRVARLLRRMSEGGEMLAGGSAQQPVQILDVRDLANFIVDRAMTGVGGLLNATGDVATLGAVMNATAAAIDAKADFVYAGDDFLGRAGLQPMSQLPLWVPQRGFPGFFRVNSARARHLGLVPRPLADTMSAGMAWIQAQARDGIEMHLPAESLPATANLPRAAEQRLIADFRRTASEATRSGKENGQMVQHFAVA